MKTKKKNKKVPAHMFGLFSAIGQAGEGLGDTLQQQGKTTLGAGISGAFNPAKAGIQYIGNKDVSGLNKALAWTGVGSIFAAKQAKKAEEARIAAQKDAQASTLNTASMRNEYWQDNNLAQTFEFGGDILPDLAYLDNNEIIRDVEGNISQVPNTTPGTDEHLVNTNNIESVLSDKLKRPGTKKTFAEEGEKVKKIAKKSKGTDKFAENTNKLNSITANKMYDQLLQEQEIVHEKKGIKKKYKTVKDSDIPAYASGIDFGNIASSIGSLAPTMFNFIKGAKSPEIESPIANPYAARSLEALSKRRINTSDIKAQNRRSRSIAGYNANKYSPSTGSNLALRNQLAVSEYSSNADLEVARQNAQNQYQGEYASALGNYGQQLASSIERTRETNAANRAARDNYLGTGFTQLGQFAQNQQLMRNQKRRDQAMLPLYENLLSGGYDENTVANFLNYLRHGR